MVDHVSPRSARAGVRKPGGDAAQGVTVLNATEGARSPAARVQAHRERRRDAGLVRVEAWVRPALVPLLRRYIARLSKSTTVTP